MSSGSGKGGLRLWDVTTSDRNEVKLNLHCLIGYWCVAVLAVLTQLDINQTLICPCLHTEGEHETLRFKTVFIYFQVIKQKSTEGHNPKDSNNAKKEKTAHLLSVVFNESFDHKLEKCVFHGCVLYKRVFFAWEQPSNKDARTDSSLFEITITLYLWSSMSHSESAKASYWVHLPKATHQWVH